MDIPITVSEFKTHFFRDFPYAPSGSPTDTNYIIDLDITKALSEASLGFNRDLFSETDEIKLAFLYLTAHYLVIDIANSSSGLAGTFQGYVSSKSVGSVSESYTIPQWILDNPIYSMFSQTRYGNKYLSMVATRAIGNVGIVGGATLP